MTTLTNSEGKVLTYTNEFIETILLQLNSSNNYYTTGDDDVIFIKIGSTKVLLLDYTYHINRTIFQNYSINENTINDYDLEFVLKNTSNEYTLQGVYTANSYIGTINSLQDVYLALYDTNTNPNSYTGSENIDITGNQISLNFPLKINGEIVINPRAYGIQFEMYAGSSGFAFLQNQQDGSQPIAIFNSLNKSVEFFGDLDIPNHYNKSSIDTLFSNIDFSNYYTKTEVDAIDDELSELILNTYTKTEVDTQLSDYTTLSHLQTTLNYYATISGIDLNFYDKTYLDNQFSLKQDTIIDKSLQLSLLYGGKYLQSIMAGNKITMEYVYSELDSNVRNIAINADLSDYYNKSYIDTNYYTSTYLNDWINAELSVIVNNFSNYYTMTYLDDIHSTLATLDYLHLKYTNSADMATAYYNKTETDNLLTSKLSVSYDTTDGFLARVPMQDSFNTGLFLENTTGSYTSFFLKQVAGIEAQLYVGNSNFLIRTNTSTRMQFQTGGHTSPVSMTIWNNQHITVHTSFTNNSDDRIKENEELIENACETLSKLRPQIYDKKPTIDSTDSTKWYKESGLIAQEVYYDCPELRHLVQRNSDDPLPEIPTSIDPKQDPDYSSWGEEPASLNYTGLIAYLIKANNELHERVKALEG
jgi:hypothetical protein